MKGQFKNLLVQAAKQNPQTQVAKKVFRSRFVELRETKAVVKQLEIELAWLEHDTTKNAFQLGKATAYRHCLKMIKNF